MNEIEKRAAKSMTDDLLETKKPEAKKPERKGEWWRDDKKPWERNRTPRRFGGLRGQGSSAVDDLDDVEFQDVKREAMTRGNVRDNDDLLEIPDFMRREKPSEVAKKAGPIVTLDLGVEGVAKMDIKSAELAMDRLAHLIGEVLEQSGVIWNWEAEQEFKFAAMKALAKCEWQRDGERRKLVISTERKDNDDE